MPATAKAALFFGPGKPFEIREVPIPEVEPGGVLIRVTHANVIQYDPWVIPRALHFLVRTKTRWPWDRILSHKYPLEKINEAFAASEWHNKETTSITRAALTP